jgi:hypothetical protein
MLYSRVDTLSIFFLLIQQGELPFVIVKIKYLFFVSIDNVSYYSLPALPEMCWNERKNLSKKRNFYFKDILFKRQGFSRDQFIRLYQTVWL